MRSVWRGMEPGHEKQAPAAPGGGPRAAGGATPGAPEAQQCQAPYKPYAGGEGRGSGQRPVLPCLERACPAPYFS